MGSVMVIVYGALALIGAGGTWYFNVVSMRAGEDYLAGWFGTAASSSAAVDVMVVAVAACAFIVLEARRQRMNAWLAAALVPLSFAVAIAFTFPLFLAWRQWHLDRVESTPSTTGIPG
jgi:hypothetical protein